MKTTRGLATAAIFLGVMMAVACGPSTTTSTTSQPVSTPAPKKEAVLYTGKSCLSQMAGMAGRWQQDALPFHMESSLNAESNGHDGKSTVWHGLFASASRRTYKAFACSGSLLAEEPPKGVTSASETPYAPNVPQLMFQPFLLHTDSDEAFNMSQEKGGAKLMEKDPQQPVIYLLDWDGKNKQLLWVVVYGTSSKDSKGAGVIDAGTGKFLRAGGGKAKG
jgi:hypothetical protein